MKNELLSVERGDIYTLEPGVKQNLASGGQASVSYQIQDSEFQPRTFVTNPFWENQLKLQLTQPLLREYRRRREPGTDHVRVTISRVSILDFRKTLEDNIAEIEKDYWDLVKANRKC